MRILVAEDEERSRKGISRLIRSMDEGYFVVGEAANGKEALERIRSHRPDAVLTDIRMPIMDGLSLIRAAHAEDLRPHFVIVSAHAEFEYAQKAISLGVREFVVKPVTYDELDAVLQRLAALPPDVGYRQERSDVHPLVSKVLCEIRNNYHRRILLEKLAETLKVTPEYLSSLFSQEMGESFSHYLQKYKVEQAKTLLAGGEKLNKVAESVGFADPKYFYKVFKKVTGVSPSQFQRDHSGS